MCPVWVKDDASMNNSGGCVEDEHLAPFRGLRTRGREIASDFGVQ